LIKVKYNTTAHKINGIRACFLTLPLLQNSSRSFYETFCQTLPSPLFLHPHKKFTTIGLPILNCIIWTLELVIQHNSPQPIPKTSGTKAPKINYPNGEACRKCLVDLGKIQKKPEKPTKRNVREKS
jgi:hypothetical protein